MRSRRCMCYNMCLSSLLYACVWLYVQVQSQYLVEGVGEGVEGGHGGVVYVSG